MSVVDIVIIIIILLGGILGFKRGFTKEVVKTIGLILAIVFAFLLKNQLASFLYDKLPFFNFDGIIKGVTVLNIALYELIAFLILLTVFLLILKIVSIASSLFEKILNATIILGFVSKIAGAIVGLTKNYILVFIILYILNLPFLNLNILDNSNMKGPILSNTPILNKFTKTSVSIMEEFVDLKDKYETSTSADEFNLDTLDLFLKYNVLTVESADELIGQGKIKTDNQERLIEILNKYRLNNENNQ